MRVLVTRPEPDGLKLKGQIEQQGHEAIVEPLLRVIYLAPRELDLEGVTALIATSRHGLRALSGTVALGRARDLTVYAVGGATAEEARRMGFGRVIKGPGTASALVQIITSTLDPSEEVLLHLAGERLAFDVVGELSLNGFQVSAETVYRMEEASALSDMAREQIADGDIEAVLLMSPQTARIYTRLVQKHGLAPAVREIFHLCMSAPTAARLAPLGELQIEVADVPTTEEILALIELIAARIEL